MNWHAPSQQEIDGQGNWAFVIDIYPDYIPHQAGDDGDALVRISRPGWSWSISDRRDKIFRLADSGYEEHRAAAIAASLEALGRLRL